MPWEERNGRRYYYSVERVHGEPRRVYRGTGGVGRLHELIDREAARRRGQRQTASAARRQFLTALAVAGRLVLNWARQVVRAARLLNGEHQHRGQWRRRLPGNSTRRRQEVTMGTTTEAGTPTGVPLDEYVLRLNDRANGGDPAALAELRALFDRHPGVWRTGADAALATAAGWANLLSDRQAAVAECIARRVAEWKAGLAGPAPTPAVEAAVDAAAVAWLAERYAQRVLHAAPPNKRPAALEKLAAANRQLQQAIRLVFDARAAADAAVTRATVDTATTASGPQLFDGTG